MFIYLFFFIIEIKNDKCILKLNKGNNIYVTYENVLNVNKKILNSIQL